MTNQNPRLQVVAREEFDFSYPYGDDPLEYAKDLVRMKFGEERVADLDWANCRISDE